MPDRLPASPAAPSRSLGRSDLVALVVNCIIGAGILGLPGRVYGQAGELTLPLLGIAALLALSIAACLADLGSRFGGAGGPPLYVEAAFGPTAGFAVGWLSWVSTVLAAASLLNLTLDYLKPLVGIANDGTGHTLLIVALAVLLTVLNLAGVRHAARTGNLLTIFKILLIGGVALLSLVFVAPAEAVPPPPPLRPANALVLLFFAFVGFERATAVAAEAVRFHRNLPFALLAGVAAVVALYALVFFACVSRIPDLAGDGRPFMTLAERAWGPEAGAGIAIGAVLVLLGTLLTQFLTAPRLLLPLADGRRLPRVVGRLFGPEGLPAVAIAITGAAIAALALTGDFVSSLTAATASRLLVFVACCLALARLPHTREAGFRVPGGRPAALIVAAACTAVLTLGIGAEWRPLALLIGIGAALFLVGRLLRR